MKKYFKYTILSFASLLMFSPEISAKTVPSFDCNKATTEVEKLICSDDELAKLDVEMNKSYHAFMKTLDEEYYRNKLKRKQIDWLGYRGKLSCFNTDNNKKTSCLKNAYQRRIENLNAWTTRKNYDFFIDYPDYYEQSKRVGYRKRMGKFISKLGEEYYIECKKDIYGGKGNDVIDAGNGNDTLVGGEGNDTLTGGVGDDTYIYNLGDGFDTISDADGTDKIVLGTGITADMLSYSREGNDLRIIINNNKLQGFLLKNQFAVGTSKIESIEFADKSTLNLVNKGFIFNQNNIDEIISGTDFNDTINAAAGDDTVNAGEGDDTITGGLGNDNLNGGNGDDTYIYNMGDGFDTITETSGADKIILGNGIALENLRFIREGNNLRILINNNVDQGFLLVNQFAGADTRIEQLQFADNSVLDLVNTSLTFEQYDGGETINGTDNDDIICGKGGNDTINAGDGDDTIIGGSGNDTLNGGIGRDTYIYNLGDGADTINEARGNDIIKFGEGITQENLTFTQEGNNLRILIDNDPYQSILINNFYSSVNNQVEKLQFSDGSTFNLSTQGLTLTQNNGDENINGTGYNDVIYGNGGHDTINAGDGNDTIVGGIGNDNLSGGNGDDTYIYNLGDGLDFITETGGSDKIVFGEGISQSDLSFEQIGNNLKISINGNEVKGIQINNHFQNDASKVETIEFYDGSTLDIGNADQLIQAMNSFSSSNSASTDTLSEPIQDVGDMYNLAVNNELARKTA